MKKFIKWIFSLSYWRKNTSPVESTLDERSYELKFVSELPQDVEDDIVYIEGNKETNDFWYALLKCPCGCQEKIMLNLMEDAKPCWNLHIKNERFSLLPSVWRTKNCKSHFFLRDNNIIWAG